MSRWFTLKAELGIPISACEAGVSVKPWVSTQGVDCLILQAREMGGRDNAIARFTGYEMIAHLTWGYGWRLHPTLYASTRFAGCAPRISHAPTEPAL